MHALLGFSGARNEAVGADMHANRAAVAAVRAASEDQDWALPKWFSWPDVQAFLVAPGLEGDPEEAARGIAQLMDQIAHRDAGHEFPLVQPSEHFLCLRCCVALRRRGGPTLPHQPEYCCCTAPCLCA
ncbi:unnamed protein product, partial [Prorocentrum cordatum]